MNIREIHPLDLRDKTDKSNKRREDIIQYYHIDKHIATLVKPNMILTINNDKSYKVNNKEDIERHIKKYYFKEDINYQYTKEDVIRLCIKAFETGATYEHMGKKADKEDLMEGLIEFYT